MEDLQKSNKNLMTSLLEEISRNRELLKEYESIPVGQFGAYIIRTNIDNAEKAIASGDLTGMIVAYEQLKDSQ